MERRDRFLRANRTCFTSFVGGSRFKGSKVQGKRNELVQNVEAAQSVSNPFQKSLNIEPGTFEGFFSYQFSQAPLM
jgi:hypothetical protein